MIMDSHKERTEIVFFDVETTVPTRPGQGFALLEFGAILVCPRTLEEVESYSTLVRPSDLSLLSSLSVRCNGITRDAVVSAPSFRDIADEVFELLQGRIWAGHNILRFDCIRVREAFSEIGRPAPEPKGTIDSLALLTQKFGRRAGDMKMASLATYFGLGRQVHRSLEDVRMNILVLKHCATVLFLESSLPDIFTEKSWVSPNVTTRSRSNGKDSPNKSSPSRNLRSENRRTLSSSDERSKEDNSLSLPSTSNLGDTILNLVQPNTDVVDSFDMSKLGSEITTQSAAPQQSPEIPPSIPVPEDCGSGFLEPEDVCIPSIHASLVPFYRGSQRMKVFHKDAWLQLFCAKLQVRFGLSTKFVDHVGRPRLSFVVDAHQGLCQVLDVCDDAAWRLLVDCGSSSEWRPTVLRKNGFFNSPTVRLNLPTVMNGNGSTYTTELYQKDLSGQTQKVDLNSVDPANLDSLLVRGTTVNAYFSLDPYDYQLHAGIRLVVKKLTVN